MSSHGIHMVVRQLNLLTTYAVNQKPAVLIKYTRVYKCSVIDVKDRYLVVSRVNLKLKLRKGNYLPEI